MCDLDSVVRAVGADWQHGAGPPDPNPGINNGREKPLRDERG